MSAVGHRSLYSKGGYTADFRGQTATDVPVKVTIPELPDELPSGIRLRMVINTGFGVDWVDDYFGYELLSVDQSKGSSGAPAPKGSQPKLPSEELATPTMVDAKR